MLSTNLNRLSTQYKEVLCSHHHETHEFLAEDLLNFIGLEAQVKMAHIMGTEDLHSNSTCLIAIEMRMELMDASIWTFSFSFLLTTTGVISSSLLLLKGINP